MSFLTWRSISSWFKKRPYSSCHPCLPFHFRGCRPLQKEVSKWIILWIPLQFTLKPKAIVQISILMRPVSWPISCQTTSLFDFEERAWSISIRRFLGFLLSSTICDSPHPARRENTKLDTALWFVIYCSFSSTLLNFNSSKIRWKHSRRGMCLHWPGHCRTYLACLDFLTVYTMASSTATSTASFSNISCISSPLNIASLKDSWLCDWALHHLWMGEDDSGNTIDNKWHAFLPSWLNFSGKCQQQMEYVSWEFHPKKAVVMLAPVQLR